MTWKRARRVFGVDTIFLACDRRIFGEGLEPRTGIEIGVGSLVVRIQELAVFAFTIVNRGDLRCEMSELEVLPE
jgi:hypothetical protein